MRGLGMMRSQRPRGIARGREGFMEDGKTSVLSRRVFLQAMAATGVVVACGTPPAASPANAVTSSRGWTDAVALKTPAAASEAGYGAKPRQRVEIPSLTGSCDT